MRIKRKQGKILIDQFEKTFNGTTVRLIAGVDPAPENAPNAMFYLRMESRSEDGERTKIPRLWLSLSELTRLSMLTTLSTRFWFETLEKRDSHSRQRIRKFREAWEMILGAVVDLLPP